jgi:Zn-dependent M28 family amino/carboxypeptidase
VSAHSDHIGRTFAPVDHDSTLAHNRVMRPLGADSWDAVPDSVQTSRITAIHDSLYALRLPRPDSINNGADDNASGTVALLEIARSLAAGPPMRRSILFISHTAEERGLAGSRWFTDHPTVPLDSIVAEVDMDMIGRNGDGSQRLVVVGSTGLSREFGDIFERVNARQARPFDLANDPDRPDGPTLYYCRSSHYSYARRGIPSMAVSRAAHPHYHQVTDEAQYIDYDGLARVTELVRDFVRTVADRTERPAIDGPPDPLMSCMQ